MKIESQQATVETQFSAAKPSGQPFEQVINRDNYYRDHKNGWQRNEFHFDKLTSKPQTTKSLKTGLEKPLAQLSHKCRVQTIDASQSSDQSIPFSLQSATSSVAVKINSKMAESKAGSFKHDNQLVNDTVNSLKQLLMVIKRQTASMQKQAIFKSVTFSNHHLFIDGKQVELAFNHLQLTPLQSKRLTEQVINLLREKGYLIKRITINGDNLYKESCHDTAN